jgi:heme-degrading monooxygenase HmoA
MYAIAVSSQIQIDKIDEATSIFRESVVPAYKQMSGFKNAMLLIDPATGKGIGISLWESEADRTAVQTSGALQQQLAKFAAVLAAPPTPYTYEVKVKT